MSARMLAEVLVDRALEVHASGRPCFVELSGTECRQCGGEGEFEVCVGGWEVPRFRLVVCADCRGTGTKRATCDICGTRVPATTHVTTSDPDLVDLCESCATDWRPLDGIDRVVAFALAVLP